MLRATGAILIVAILVGFARPASAQIEIVPAPQADVPMRPAPQPTAPPPAGQGASMLTLPERTAPSPAPPSVTMPLQLAAPELPKEFRGCWQGIVEELDSIQREPGGHKLGYWTAKTYRLCYKRVGTGPYELTFGETGTVPSEKIKYSKGRVDVISTDGTTQARMRAFLHFDEYPVGTNAGASTFSVDEVTMLDCRIVKDAMHVDAQVSGRREDAPWFRARWHTTLARAEGASSD
ncbi:MAG TPA: hypothetical protein VEF03_02485 [Candidatus Binataceae bacterium]|nr:hypothetical protein [Candidatus Binataceae bacterium]